LCLLRLSQGRFAEIQRADSFWSVPMTVSAWTNADSERAQRVWSDYQRRHDVSDKTGQTAGIDPATGRIWFGDSIQDVIARRDADGIGAPLFFVRVGSETYYRKGGHLKRKAFSFAVSTISSIASVSSVR
jgi:hypothetical protein